MHATDHFLEGAFVATLESYGDFEILFFGFCSGGENASNSGGIDGDGFLEECVFSEADRLFEVGWAESARGSKNHDIGEGSCLLIGIDSYELIFDRNIGSFGVLGFEGVETRLELVWEEICDGDEAGVRVGSKSLVRRASTATAASDEGDFERVVRFRSSQYGGETRCRGHGEGTRKKKRAAINKRFF